MPGKLIIVDDEESESFSTSPCDCIFCEEMHRSNREWDTFVPETNLQKRMKAVVEKWEKKPIKKRN